MRDCIIVDIDWTLANNKRRSPYDTALCIDDKLIEPVAKICNTIWCKVILVSWRFEKFREITEKWLLENKVAHDELYMRPDEDFRKDDEVKEEIYNQKIKPHYNVLFAIDDRNRVVDKRRNIWIFTFDVNQTREEF